MKKILLLLLFTGVLISCSDDDDVQENDASILGTWFLVEANNVPNFSINECTSQSYLSFMADNTANSEFFTNAAGECESESSSGDWSNSSGSQYTFTVPGFGELTGTVSFNGDRFTFTPNDIPTSSLTFEK
ncbi:lipocalin family protein [Christiangramia portivictoriae]|uniref:lipocalin family protein n=1 Tax=Christiangramia portivictoriae TaxID=326069 RepID=UPI0004111E27|nr:lipocalin family protein [Christiangramia portivictoriae]